MTDHSPAPELTAEQQRVINHGDGHARVTAVAGAGKTSTMVARVDALLNDGVPPERLLILMFNRQARDDFAAKLAARRGQASRLPQVRTFHSIGHRLTQSLTRWGVLDPRQLLQADWQRERLLKQAVGEAIGDDRATLEWALEPERLEEFGQFCALVKAELLSPSSLFERDGYSRDSRYYIEAFDYLQQRMADQGLMTYDDLLYRPLMALEADPALAARVQGFMDHIIIDEYQDINEVQLRLLASLAGSRAQVMAVGDADQCIYAWRGARPDAMLDGFARVFGDSTPYALSRTFRHGHRLALLANHAIRANERADRPLCLAAEGTPTTTLAVAGSLDAIIASLGRSAAFEQCAILVRHWSLSVPVQLQLLRAGIPFQLGRQERFVFRLPLVQALAGYIELASEPSLLADPAHVELLFSQPTPFVARERLTMLCEALARRGEWFARNDAQLSGLSRGQQRTLKKRWELLVELARVAGRWTPATVLTHVIDTLDAHKLLKRAAARPDKGEEDVRLLEVLVEQAQAMADDPAGFVAMLKAPVEDQPGGVIISTVHGAKGLEWDQVFVYGLNEEDFPFYHRESPLTPARLEEERRLYYVAVTRARASLMLVHDGVGHRPSRFIAESAWQECDRIGGLMAPDAVVPDELPVEEPALVRRYLAVCGMEKPHVAPHPSTADGNRTVSLRNDTDWPPGQRVDHRIFGTGTIQHVSGEGERRVLTVQFDTAGTRKLIAAQAPLSLLSP
ncbi:ATP-dependent helicase [Larsenimonas rhizosphaerae]|uniref:ATP-dependent helicase n=1 Tax=Larsenimonas rhizosphaerae TaxID=2944682 RepID=UPI0020342429|nr:ATP-dependent helicase [Larsenimonas rhizosphaerae]MCM2130952.1 ATP-dependent helicase [Larsenimonas rhizosphaerae]